MLLCTANVQYQAVIDTAGYSGIVTFDSNSTHSSVVVDVNEAASPVTPTDIVIYNNPAVFGLVLVCLFFYLPYNL